MSKVNVASFSLKFSFNFVNYAVMSTCAKRYIKLLNVYLV